MSTANRSALWVSIAAGLIAVALIWVYLSGRESELLKLSEMKDVVVARKEVPSRTVLDESMLERIQVPARYLQPGAVTAVADAVGRVAAVPFLTGAQIVSAALEDQGTSALAYEVPRGRRAITIPVSEVTGVGGLVKPGNYVDIFGTFDYGRPVAVENGVMRYADERTETRLMLQNVLVVAVGRTHRRAPDAPGQAGAIETPEERQQRLARERERQEFTNVTMLVEPQQAQQLVLAQEIGQLSLALRSNLDAGALTEFPNLDPEKLLNVPIPVKKRGPVFREMRGGRF